MSHGMVPGDCELGYNGDAFHCIQLWTDGRYMRIRKESINTYTGFLVG